MVDTRDKRFGTCAVHAGTKPEPVTGAIMTPVFQTSTYVQPGPAQAKLHEYSRTGNPTRDALQAAIAALEGVHEGDQGGGLSFSSGMAAIDTVLRLLKSGDHVVAGNDLYGGTYRLFTKVLSRFGLTFSFVEAGDPDAIRAAIKKETRLVWIETPTNPLLKIVDIARAAEIARAAGAWLGVDNTFATPCLQRPLALGADFVVHSTTKYMGGHSDVVGGAVVVKDKGLLEQLAFHQNAIGAVPGPWDCFLTLRGIKTLHIRMARHCENAAKVAGYLSEHAQVSKVYYPGHPSHAGHAVAMKQMSGQGGGMVSFELKGGVPAGAALCVKTKLFQLAESLGGVESLIEHPPSMTHASVAPEARRAAGMADGLIRLSVGIEDADDLIGDLEQGLAQLR